MNIIICFNHFQDDDDDDQLVTKKKKKWMKMRNNNNYVRLTENCHVQVSIFAVDCEYLFCSFSILIYTPFTHTYHAYLGTQVNQNRGKRRRKVPHRDCQSFYFFSIHWEHFRYSCVCVIGTFDFFDFYFSFVQTAIDCEKIGKNKTYESVTNWLQSMQSINQSKWSIDRMIDWSVKVSQVNIVKKKNSSFFHSRCKIKKRENKYFPVVIFFIQQKKWHPPLDGMQCSIFIYHFKFMKYTCVYDIYFSITQQHSSIIKRLM